MTEAERILQIEQQMLRLDGEIKATQEKLYALYNELQQLKKGVANEPVNFTTQKKLPVKENNTFENFVGLRLIHLVGIVVLVIGLSIGVKYAIDKELISEVARVLLAYSAGFALYFLSLRLKKAYLLFSAILFSGAMASLYFTTYGAFVYYAIIPFVAAFAVMIVLTIFTVYNAIWYSRQEIALLGLVGAYGIPFLISQNNDRVAMFFLYIAIINAAVVFLYVKKNWKGVGRAAFFITWILYFGWAFVRSQPDMKWTGFLFSLIFYFLFLFQSLSRKLIYKEAIERDDALLVFLNNVALYFSTLILFSIGFAERSMAAITLFFFFFLATQSFLFYRFWKEEVYLNKLVWGAAVFLLIYFISLQWDGLAVTLLWLLTAVVIFVAGIVRKSAVVRVTGMIIMGATLLKLLMIDTANFTPVQKIISYIVIGILLLLVSFFYQKFKAQLFDDDE